MIPVSRCTSHCLAHACFPSSCTFLAASPTSPLPFMGGMYAGQGLSARGSSESFSLFLSWYA